MKFVNREEELALLNNLYKKASFQFIPVYGRRRVGKTRLVQEFIQGKPAIYYLADSVSEVEQLKNLGREVGNHFKDSILQEAGFKDWYQFFEYLAKKSSRKRIAMIIDEFPYLVNSNRAISSIFQKGIDTHLKNSSVFLILLGSSIGMMEREMLFYKAPLYGRRTASLEINEMSFDSLKDFFPKIKFDDLVAIYGIAGGIPAYLEMINQDEGIFENIKQIILKKRTFLYNEVEFLLREELREPRNYFVILRSIAQGKRKLSEIINDTGFEKTLLSRYLDILRKLRLIDKEVPITDKDPERSKQGLYKIHDKFFSFWFRYIFPNRSKLEIGDVDYVMKIIDGTFDHYLSFIFENICKDTCRKLIKEGKIHFTSIGRWWSRNEEIDVVALDEENRIACFGECKWSNKKVGEDVFRELLRKSSLVEWEKGRRKDCFIMFSKSGFTPAMHRIAKEHKVLLVEKDKLLSNPEV